MIAECARMTRDCADSAAEVLSADHPATAQLMESLSVFATRIDKLVKEIQEDPRWNE
jgi:hypothetical protein